MSETYEFTSDIFILTPKVDTFFEFSDRLESIMAKAYIWR